MSKPVEVIFSKEDRIILESYKSVVEGLAEYMGDGYEFVLHSLENFDHSVIKIINGHHTGRKEGAPVTDLALEMLSKIQNEDLSGHIAYFTKNKKGEPLKSSTIAIEGTEKKIIGLLCINLYLNSPLLTFVNSLHSEVSLKENFESVKYGEDSEKIVSKASQEALRIAEENPLILPSLKHREAIAYLEEQGIFKIKDSVVLVAKFMNISKHTVYLHLRNIRNEQKNN